MANGRSEVAVAGDVKTAVSVRQIRAGIASIAKDLRDGRSSSTSVLNLMADQLEHLADLLHHHEAAADAAALPSLDAALADDTPRTPSAAERFVADAAAASKQLVRDWLEQLGTVAHLVSAVESFAIRQADRIGVPRDEIAAALGCELATIHELLS